MFVSKLVQDGIIDHDELLSIMKEKKDYDSQKNGGYKSKISNVEVNFFVFLLDIRMVVITVEAYQNAQVHTITVKNKYFFWVKMKNVQDKLGIKNITQHVKDELRGKFETNNLTKEQKQQYVRSEYQITKVETDNKKEKFVKIN